MGTVKRKILYFTAPRQVEIREETLPAPGADEVLVETTCSAHQCGDGNADLSGSLPA